MSLRYFATNRDRENLGRETKRADRISLQQGGYHILDMKAYMSHYLAEVDAKTMPDGVIVKNSKKTLWEDYLEQPEVKQVVVCVHGFNVNLHDAQTWFGILTDSLRKVPALADRIVTDPLEADKDRLKNGKNLIAFVGFSWPSNGSVLSSPSDPREAIGSTGPLANLLARIGGLVPQPKLSLICHSMGNYLACHMFKQLLADEIAPIVKNRSANLESEIGRDDPTKDQHSFVDRYIMLAPDVERRHVTKCVNKIVENPAEEEATYIGPFYGGLEHLCGEVHNFYSRFDGALAISNVEKAPRKAVAAAKGLANSLTLGMLDFLERNPDNRWEQRLGATQHPMMSPPNMESHNAVEISNREIDHSDYVDSAKIAGEIGKILAKP